MAEQSVSPRASSRRAPDLRDVLSGALHAMRLAEAVMTTACLALRFQDGDQDREIALLLQRCGSDRLCVRREELEAVLARLEREERAKPAPTAQPAASPAPP